MKHCFVNRMAALVLSAVMSITLLMPVALADEKATLSLDQKEIVLAAGDTFQLNAQISDEQELVWSSLTTDVVSVDENGLVTALKEGQSAVRVATLDESVSATCRVRVHMAFPVYSLRVGEVFHLATEWSDAVWSCENEKIATVDPNGAVTGVSFGKTYVTAESAEGRETFSISVGGHVGIDISSWNETIDWDAVLEQGIEYVIIRAGYGWEHTDKNFIANIEGAIECGIPIGVYFYSYAETAEKAQVEANYCKNLLEPYKEHIILPVAYDLEQYKTLSGEELTEFAQIFCTTLQDAGYHTMVYANGGFFEDMDLHKLNRMGVDFWFAWYPAIPNLNTIPSVQISGMKPHIWQYSSNCVVQGALAGGKTDVNVMYMPEYVSFLKPELTAVVTLEGAELHWSGSTYAKQYTIYRQENDGRVTALETAEGRVHHYTDATHEAGAGYYVTMDICDPIDGTYYQSYTSEVVYPEKAVYEVSVTAQEGGTVSGGGRFSVGDRATVDANAKEGYLFEGWFDSEGALISSEKTYSFTVSKTVELTAMFSKEEISFDPVVFDDVKETDWYYDAVQYAVRNGLFTGMSETEFAPKGTMNRAMLVTVLYRQAGAPEASNRNKFVDVHKDAWYARAVTWAYDNGVVNGTGEKTFSPTDPVTRQQIATILMRYSNAMNMELPDSMVGDLSVFTDGDQVQSWYVEGVQWAVSTQLMNGSNGYLRPRDSASRAECATMLMRWLESDQA